MSNVRRFFRDPFTFSCRGITATASFFITPVIADDTINRAWDAKLSKTDANHEEIGATARAPIGEAVTQSAG